MVSWLRVSNIQDISFITYGELTGTTSDCADGAVVIIIGCEKDISDEAFRYVKLAFD